MARSNFATVSSFQIIAGMEENGVCAIYLL